MMDLTLEVKIVTKQKTDLNACFLFFFFTILMVIQSHKLPVPFVFPPDVRDLFADSWAENSQRPSRHVLPTVLSKCGQFQ